MRVSRAILHMCAATALFSLLNATAKHLGPELPMGELLWARTFGHLAVVVIAFGPRHGRRLFATRHPAFQLLRSLLLLASTAFNFLALRFIGLATAAAINFTSPFIVALLAAPMLGERVGPMRWLASRLSQGRRWAMPQRFRVPRIAVGFLGVLVVVGPGAETAQLASALSLGTAACYAVYQLLTRRVAASDPPETTAGYSALVGTVLTTAVVPFVWVTPASAATFALMLSMGVTGGLGHYFVARAYLWAPASVVSPFNYIQLLGAATTGYFLFGEVPGPALWLGAGLIVGSGLFIAYSETALRPVSARP